jgi:lysyl-tRNA synthetase class I
VVGIPLPSSPAYSLKLNESYRWRLIIDCDPNKTSENVLELYGSVTRVQQDSNAWYDNLTNLAQRYLSEPQNSEVKKAWTELLKSVGLEELAQAPLVKLSQ